MVWLQSRERMPRLLIFAPCERVIIGQGDNVVSLIGILQSVHIQPSGPNEAAEIPASAAIPMQWSVFTMWQKEAVDNGEIYTQRVVLVSPTDRPLIESVTRFVMEKDSHRIANIIRRLPIGEVGIHTLKLLLRRGDSGNWDEISSFPLSITRPAIVPSPSRPQ